MCSISGVITSSEFQQNGVLKAVVARMNSALQHRGPDDQGIFEHTPKTSSRRSIQVCLGNTRLAIIDTSRAGHQPMIDPENGICVTYNGEAYNFRELRAEIGNEFGQWISNSDTEVVLRAYKKWGLDGLRRLRGMFAVAIWNPIDNELILARDSFGIKPLYYTISEDGPSHQLVFASEIRAILSSGLVRRRLSAGGLASYLNYGSVEAPLTIVDKVNSVMPGECVVIRPTAEGLQIKSVVTKKEPPKVPDVESFATRTDAAIRLRKELEASVRAHLVSDVPLGVFLSGGMDSSALVGLMTKVSGEPPRTFSIVFDDQNLSEARHSRLIADRFQTAHQEILLKEGQLLCQLPDALRSFDQPSMDGVNTYVVSRAVKAAGVTVALSGLGGDELFAGYPSFSRTMQIQSVSAVTRRVLKAASVAGRFGLRGSVARNKFWQLAASAGTPNEVYRITRQLFDPSTINALVGCPYESNKYRVDLSEDPINYVSVLELEGYMANTLLRDTDGMSMAHSLEVRVPFVDVDVVRFALSVPGRMKLNGGPPHTPKPLLAAALSDLLPLEFLARPKMGFTLPFESWLQSRLQNEVSAVLCDEPRLQSIGLDSKTVGGIWNRFRKAPRNVGWSRPWALYVLAKWCEVNQVGMG
jgi:asparagine synthase (glutamine-hydrolysing)